MQGLWLLLKEPQGQPQMMGFVWLRGIKMWEIEIYTQGQEGNAWKPYQCKLGASKWDESGRQFNSIIERKSLTGHWNKWCVERNGSLKDRWRLNRLQHPLKRTGEGLQLTQAVDDSPGELRRLRRHQLGSKFLMNDLCVVLEWFEMHKFYHRIMHMRPSASASLIEPNNQYLSLPLEVSAMILIKPTLFNFHVHPFRRRTTFPMIFSFNCWSFLIERMSRQVKVTSNLKWDETLPTLEHVTAHDITTVLRFSQEWCRFCHRQ